MNTQTRLSLRRMSPSLEAVEHPEDADLEAKLPVSEGVLTKAGCLGLDGTSKRA